jgi:hypothetical protein
MSTRGAKAWLVTWEWCGEHAKRDEKVAAVFDSRVSPGRIREYVELLYAHETYTLSERIAWCLGNQNRNPYPAEFVKLEGVPWEGEIHCGHNPYLRARLVDELTIRRGKDGKETPTWKDRYSAGEARKKIAAMKNGMLEQMP